MKRTAHIEYDGPDGRHGSGFVRTHVITRTARYGSPITAGVRIDDDVVRFEVTVYDDGRVEFTETSTVNGRRRTQTLCEVRIAF